MKTGKVYLIGAGPGDPGLITVKAREILRQADMVIYDYLVNKEILAEAKPQAELICCDKLEKKRYADGFLPHQEKINKFMVQKAKEGKKVVRLKNGDVSIFSRLSQELDTLVREKIEFEVVPGVTAASAASALSGIPLTDRRFASSCIFVTGHEDSKKKTSSLDWNSLAKNGTIVLYMAMENLSKITKQLIKGGRRPDTAVAIVQDVSLLSQKTLVGTLRDIVLKAKREKIRPPAIIIIGEVVGLEKRFNWFRNTKKTLFTGISAKRYFEKGIFIHLPLIKIKPLTNYRQLDQSLRNIQNYDWIVFTSRYGVEYFFNRLKVAGYDARVLQKIKVAVIGNSTKSRLEEFGVLADLVPKKESSAGLLEEFKKIDIKYRRIFLPRSDISDKGLTKGLEKTLAKVTSVVAYRNVAIKGLPDLDLDFFDEIMFTSPSGVRNFVKRYKTLPRKVKVSCIGDVTCREAEKWHLVD